MRFWSSKVIVSVNDRHDADPERGDAHHVPTPRVAVDVDLAQQRGELGQQRRVGQRPPHLGARRADVGASTRRWTRSRSCHLSPWLSTVSFILAMAKPQAWPGCTLPGTRDLLGVGDDVEQHRAGMRERARARRRRARAGSSTRTPCRPIARATAAKSGLCSARAELGQPALLLLELHHAEAAVVEDHQLHRQVVGHGGHAGRRAASTGRRRRRRRSPGGCGRGPARRAPAASRWPSSPRLNEPEQPAGAGHHDEARQPHRRHAGVGGEHRVLVGALLDGAGQRLGSDALGGVVELLAHPADQRLVVVGRAPACAGAAATPRTACGCA